MNNIKVKENLIKNSRRKPEQSLRAKWVRRDRSIYGTDKQIAFYKTVLAFVRENGIDTSIFERPRNLADCNSKINAMFTVIRKNNLLDKFFEEEGD